MDSKSESLINEEQRFKQENVLLKVKVRKQEKGTEKLVREIRKNNLVVKGIVDDEQERNGKTRIK